MPVLNHYCICVFELGFVFVVMFVGWLFDVDLERKKFGFDLGLTEKDLGFLGLENF